MKTKTRKNTGTHGGARPGSGPKHNVYADPICVSLRLPRKLWGALDKFAKLNNQNRNRLIVETMQNTISR